MDTRFWGPSGWKLLHLMTFSKEALNPVALHEFFTLLPYVLPCKFCRASLSDYYAVDPVPSKVSVFKHWLYRIHNRVNGKLRDQHLLKDKDPEWSAIQMQYKAMIDCSEQQFVGWDFLYSVIHTTPGPHTPSAPMPSAPPLDVLTTPELRNRWNLMSRGERLPLLTRWWQLLPHVLPYKSWRSAWSSANKQPALTNNKRAITAWLFSVEQHLCKTLQVKARHASLSGVCCELRTFASGCASKKTRKTNTCRSKTLKRSKLLNRVAA